MKLHPNEIRSNYKPETYMKERIHIEIDAYAIYWGIVQLKKLWVCSYPVEKSSKWYWMHSLKPCDSFDRLDSNFCKQCARKHIRNIYLDELFVKILIKMHTPDKSELNTSSFSPVRFIDSPSHIKSVKNDNIGIRIRLKAAVKTIVENHYKWDAAHCRGITLCKSIEKSKSHAIKTFNDHDDNVDKTLYPTELKPICDKLQVITTIFEDVQNSAIESRRQIVSFIKLGLTNVFVDSPLVFRTWKCTTLQDAIDNICNAYKNEYKIKVNVMENIAHSRTDDELAMHLAVWEYQTYINADIEFLMKSLIIEADIELDDNT